MTCSDKKLRFEKVDLDLFIFFHSQKCAPFFYIILIKIANFQVVLITKQWKLAIIYYINKSYKLSPSNFSNRLFSCISPLSAKFWILIKSFVRMMKWLYLAISHCRVRISLNAFILKTRFYTLISFYQSKSHMNLDIFERTSILRRYNQDKWFAWVKSLVAAAIRETLNVDAC